MRHHRIHIAIAAGAALLLGACSNDPAAPGPTPAFSLAAERAIGTSLVQRVRLSTNQPARGDTLVIRSVITNRGTAPESVEHTVCGFDYDRDDVLHSPFIMCAAYSATTVLAPGDSIMHEDRRVVSARPGHYVLGIAHLVQPKTSVAVGITVR